jgi:hypothetical protein
MDNRLNGNNNCQNARLVEVLNQLYQVNKFKYVILKIKF